jgi:hypothetical protein
MHDRSSEGIASQARDAKQDSTTQCALSRSHLSFVTGMAKTETNVEQHQDSSGQQLKNEPSVLQQTRVIFFVT